jgi:hypothetical protein
MIGGGNKKKGNGHYLRKRNQAVKKGEERYVSVTRRKSWRQ